MDSQSKPRRNVINYREFRGDQGRTTLRWAVGSRDLCNLFINCLLLSRPPVNRHSGRSSVIKLEKNTSPGVPRRKFPPTIQIGHVASMVALIV